MGLIFWSQDCMVEHMNNTKRMKRNTTLAPNPICLSDQRNVHRCLCDERWKYQTDRTFSKLWLVSMDRVTVNTHSILRQVCSNQAILCMSYTLRQNLEIIRTCRMTICRLM